MNWTGGRLQRHSKSDRGSITRRQREHFAKTRSKAQHHSQNSECIDDFRPDFLRHERTSISPRGAQTTLSAAVHCPVRQTPGAALDGTQKRLARSNEVKNAVKCPVSTSRAHRPEISQIEGSRRRPPSKAGASTSQRGSKQLRDVERYQDLLNRNDHMHKSSQQIRRNPEMLSKEEADFEMARQNLLRQTDWLRLGHCRPLHIEFPDDRDRSAIGKRRKVDSGDQYESHRSPVHYHPRAKLQDDLSGRHSSCTSPPTHVRVRIGTDALGSGSSEIESASIFGDGKKVPVSGSDVETKLPETD